ncbi:MAG: NADAR family protein [Polyangiaceae bacterium]
MRERILFYSVGDPFGEFSNFAAFPIKLGGKRWPTSEHYFQAQKFAAPQDREQVRAARTPSLAAREGRDRKKRLRRDWESAKVSVMREAVEAKFRQHPQLGELLLSTGDAELVEHTESDSFWGDGGDGSGRNMLGRILMDVRTALRSEDDGDA